MPKFDNYADYSDYESAAFMLSLFLLVFGVGAGALWLHMGDVKEESDALAKLCIEEYAGEPVYNESDIFKRCVVNGEPYLLTLPDDKVTP